MVKNCYISNCTHFAFIVKRKLPKTMVFPAFKVTHNSIEKSFWEQGSVVVGIDEVGRGCLAGPLVTAAAILPQNMTHPLLKDSKVLSLPERLEAYDWITKNCLYQIGIVHNRIIDTQNIYQATHIAMKKALVGVTSLCKDPIGAIVVDAVPLQLAKTGLQEIPLYHFYKGETKSSSIAAASIIAKVTRDRLMDSFEELFPGYAFDQHKGYATEMHQNAITSLQESLIHRRAFMHAFLDQGLSNDQNSQQTLF